MKKYYYVKCMFDTLLSAFGIIMTSWVMLLCILFLKADEPKGKLFYNALRIGKGGRPFKMYKFRTMKSAFEGKDAYGDVFTRAGKVLRKTSLDELPQLFNILKGDMSFIGPRPLLPHYHPYYNQAENRRHEVRPGMTGLAQVRGRVNLNWDKRFGLDVQYVDHLSLKQDLSIIMETFKVILGKKNVLLDPGGGVTEDFDEYRRKQLREQIHKMGKTT